MIACYVELSGKRYPVVLDQEDGSALFWAEQNRVKSPEHNRSYLRLCKVLFNKYRKKKNKDINDTPKERCVNIACWSCGNYTCDQRVCEEQ